MYSLYVFVPLQTTTSMATKADMNPLSQLRVMPSLRSSSLRLAIPDLLSNCLTSRNTPLGSFVSTKLHTQLQTATRIFKGVKLLATLHVNQNPHSETPHALNIENYRIDKRITRAPKLKPLGLPGAGGRLGGR